MATPLSPEAKKKILRAYREFKTAATRIAHEHRTTVKSVLAEVDKRQVDNIKKKIGI